MKQYSDINVEDERSDEPATLRRQAKDWVVHMATGSVTQADVRALTQWRSRSVKHEEAFEQARNLWQALGEPLESSATARTAPTDRRWRSALNRRALLGGALATSAAATAAMLVWPPYDLWPSIAEMGAEYRTGAGEQRAISFPNHASIELNTRTALNINRGAQTKNIEMIVGEAAVTAEQEPLTVLASGGRLRAMNSQFVVRCDSSGVRVTCVAGEVDVTYGGQNRTVQHSQQIFYHAGVITPAVVINPEAVTAWRNGLLVFDDERLSHVIDEINRYRSARIILMNEALGERRITARFRVARLDAVLTQFQTVFGAKVTALPGGFVVLS